MRNCTPHAVLLASVAMGLGFPTPVPAQENQDLRLEEVIVTARRREELAQDVPISMTVFNQSQLDDRNILSASDLAMGVALNLSFDPTSGLLTASGTHLAGNFVSGAQSYDSNFVSYNLTASNIVPVPEPGTALLMGLGLAGLTGAGGRRSAA